MRARAPIEEPAGPPTPDEQSRERPPVPLARPLLVAGVLLGALAVGALSGRLPSAEEVRDFAGGFGPLGPLVFVPVSVGLSCAWVPGPILAGAAGLLFGTALGVPVAVASAAVGAVTQMLIVRHGAGRRALAAVTARTRRIDAFLERRGVLAVLYLRLLPGIPFVATNYGAGLTRLGVTQMAVGTAIGSLPRSFAYVALGGSLDDLSSPEARLAIALLVVFGVVGIVVAAMLFRADRRAGTTKGGEEDPPEGPLGAA